MISAQLLFLSLYINIYRLLAKNVDYLDLNSCTNLHITHHFNKKIYVTYSNPPYFYLWS